MKIENNISGFLGTSATKAIAPGLALSIPYFIASIAFIKLSPYAWFAGGVGFKAIIFASILLGLITSFLWVFIKNMITYPKSVQFEEQSIRISYRFGSKVEYMIENIAGVSRDSKPGRTITLRFEMLNGKEFSVMTNLYQSKGIYRFLDNLGLTVF